MKTWGLYIRRTLATHRWVNYCSKRSHKLNWRIVFNVHFPRQEKKKWRIPWSRMWTKEDEQNVVIFRWRFWSLSAIRDTRNQVRQSIKILSLIYIHADEAGKQHSFVCLFYACFLLLIFRPSDFLISLTFLLFGKKHRFWTSVSQFGKITKFRFR